MNVLFCNKTNQPITSCQMHSHDCWEIILHLEGHVTSVIGQKEYYISEGDIMVIPPNIMHDGNSDSFYCDMYLQCENMSFNDVTVLHDYDGGVLTLMNLIHKTYTERDKNYAMISDSLLNAISSYLEKYSLSEYKYDFVTELKNEIYLNISNGDFHIADTVKKMGYNIDYMRRCFKEETGQTPLEYLNLMRLNYAKELLLQDTFISVVDVSEKCGFNDSFYFSKLFKKYFGISPNYYRKQRTSN